MIEPATLSRRILGTIKLDKEVIGEIERDETATGQAVAVVALAGLANGIGVAVTGPIGYLGLLIALIGNFAAWVFFAGAAYAVGVGVLPGEGTEAESEFTSVLRTLGFAIAPNVLGIAVIIGLIGQFISFLGFIWALVCAIAAIEVSLRVSTMRALAIGMIAGVMTLIVVTIALNVLSNVV